MSNKQCKKCGEIKPLKEFHKNKGTRDGHVSTCKTCRMSEQVRERKASTISGLRRCGTCGETKTLGMFVPDTSKPNSRKNTCRDCRNANDRQRRENRGRKPRKEASNPRTNRQKYLASLRRWREENPLAKYAHEAVHQATKTKAIPRPESLCCLKCSRIAAHYHHFLGYEPEHWLDVIPLCRSCHRLEHSNIT